MLLCVAFSLLIVIWPWWKRVKKLSTIKLRKESGKQCLAMNS